MALTPALTEAGKIVDEAITLSGLSLRQVAATVGVSPALLSAIRHGDRVLSPDVRRKLEAAPVYLTARHLAAAAEVLMAIAATAHATGEIVDGDALRAQAQGLKQKADALRAQASRGAAERGA